VWLSLVRRYRQHGLAGLVELDRDAVRHPNQTAVAIEEAVLGLRQAHMRWGPRKLKRIWNGISRGALAGGEHDGRDREARGAGGGAPEASPDRALHGATSACVESNRVWCADFKGWFKSGDGRASIR